MITPAQAQPLRYRTNRVCSGCKYIFQLQQCFEMSLDDDDEALRKLTMELMKAGDVTLFAKKL